MDNGKSEVMYCYKISNNRSGGSKPRPRWNAGSWSGVCVWLHWWVPSCLHTLNLATLWGGLKCPWHNSPTHPLFFQKGCHEFDSLGTHVNVNLNMWVIIFSTECSKVQAFLVTIRHLVRGGDNALASVEVQDSLCRVVLSVVMSTYNLSTMERFTTDILEKIRFPERLNSHSGESHKRKNWAFWEI